MSGNSNPTTNHLERIDVLRAVAILLVVCFHFLPSVTGQYEFDWGGVWRNTANVQTPLMWCLYPVTLGWSGVSLFFVISGFCIHYSFLRFETNTSGKGFLKMFFWKRFWRIYPAYFLTLTAFYFLALRHPESGASVGDFWLHATLVHNFDAGAFFGINPSFWSLAVEMQFYLLFPLVLAFRNRIGMKGVFWVFAGVSVACRIAALFFQAWDQPPTQFLWYFTLTLFVDWLLGAWLAERWLAEKRLLGVSPGQTLAFGILVVAFTWNKISMAVLGFTAFSLWYAMLMELYLFSSRPFGQLERLMVPVGLCSYSIYLWHQPLLDRALYWLHKLGFPQTAFASLAAMPVVVLAMIILGFASYKLVELPGINLGKRLQKKLNL